MIGYVTFYYGLRLPVQYLSVYTYNNEDCVVRPGAFPRCKHLHKYLFFILCFVLYYGGELLEKRNIKVKFSYHHPHVEK